MHLCPFYTCDITQEYLHKLKRDTYNNIIIGLDRFSEGKHGS
jgi:hypothetical protein